jgi:hypothetical protein
MRGHKQHNQPCTWYNNVSHSDLDLGASNIPKSSVTGGDAYRDDSNHDENVAIVLKAKVSLSLAGLLLELVGVDRHPQRLVLERVDHFATRERHLTGMWEKSTRDEVEEGKLI